MDDELLGRTVKLDYNNSKDIAEYIKNPITGINEWIRTFTGEKLGPIQNMFIIVDDREKIENMMKNEKSNVSFFTIKNIILIGLIICIVIIIYYAIYENYENYKKKKKNK